MDNIKALRVSDFPEEAWVILSGEGSGRDRTIIELYEAVDYLYRGVTLRAQKLASVPFIIEGKGGRFIYDSEELDPPPKGFEWLASLPITLELIEAAICLGGRAYIFPQVNPYNFAQGLQWIKPTSITPHFDLATGELLHFKRWRPQGEIIIPSDDLIYFWPPDPTVETGPAQRYPGRAAMSAAGVMANMDEFLEHYFGRGAIKVTLLTSEGVIGRDQRELLKTWWQKVAAGVKNAFAAEVVNASKVTPVVIGEGVKDLENTALTNEKREAICAALGVPPSKMLPSAANYATKQSDDVMLVSDTVVPELRWIAPILNQQLFSRWGMTIRFRPEDLPEMQVDEAQRAESLERLVGAGMPLRMALDILGYDVGQEWEAKLINLERQQEEMRENLAQMGQQQQGPPGQASQQEDDEKKPRPKAQTDEAYDLAKRLAEAGRFERWLRNDPTRDPDSFTTDLLTPADKLHIYERVAGKRIDEAGRFHPVGMAVTSTPPTVMELSDPEEIARLVAKVERWAKERGLILGDLLNAEPDDLEP